jgi:hypothetical protein
MCAAIALKLEINDLQIKFKDGCYQPIFSVQHLIGAMLARVYHYFENRFANYIHQQLKINVPDMIVMYTCCVNNLSVLYCSIMGMTWPIFD